MDPQNCLRPVELDMSGLVLLGSGFFDKFNEFFQNLTGQVAAAPVECKCFILLCSLPGALVNFLRLCEGKFFLFIVKVVAVRTGRGGGDQRLMVAEDRLIVQIEVVVADLTAGLNAFSKAVVEGGIQVIASLTDLHDIPCMAVLDPFFRIVSA